jgi:hypothetical protein
MAVTLSPILSPKTYPTDSPESVLRQLASLVAQIYATFSFSSQNGYIDTAKREEKFKNHSYESADQMRLMGKTGVGIAAAGLVLSVALLVLTRSYNEAIQQFCQQMATQASSGVSKLTESYQQSTIKHCDTKAQLDQMSLQSNSNRSASEANTKEQFAQVLQAEMQRLRSASTAGGA